MDFKHQKSSFIMPHRSNGEPMIYLNGNSLGLQPQGVSEYFSNILDDWARWNSHGYVEGSSPWKDCAATLLPSLGRLVGANVSEMGLMNSLTVNIHSLLHSFYQPTPKRYKIICIRGFSSDRFALNSHIHRNAHLLSQFNVSCMDEALVEIPLDENHLFQWDTFEQVMQEHGESTCLLWLEGVHYLTGQALPIPEITNLAQQYECLVGFDLAHAIGNIHLDVHAWNVDFAAWCHYKYLSGGPGAIAGLYVHERHARNVKLPHMAGWWGQSEGLDFSRQDFKPHPTALGWQMSCPNPFSLAILLQSLKIFDGIDILQLCAQNKALSCYLEQQLREKLNSRIKIISPCERGAQLTVKFEQRDVENILYSHGVVCDSRLSYIRFACYGLYVEKCDIDKLINLLIREGL